MITKLTPEQEAYLVEFRTEWFKIGCDCSPANRPVVETTITEMYRRLNEPLPRFEWYDSPRACAEAVKRLTGDTDAIWRCRWGQHESAWVAFYTFCEAIGGKYTAEQSQLLGLWRELAKAANWWWPLDGVCICSEKPMEIHWDDRNRLHHPDKKAVSYRDGWGVYAWHGTRVPEKIIMSPESYTSKELASQQNVEITRALAEKLGWEKYLAILGTKVIDSWTDPKTGLSYELHEPKVRHGELQPRFLRKQSSVLHDGSQPYYLEAVHPGLTTAAAARKCQAMMGFVDQDEREMEALVRHCNEDSTLEYDWER